MSLRGRRTAFGALAALAVFALTATGDAIYTWILFFQALLLLLGFVQVRLTIRAVELETELPEGQTESGSTAELPLKALIAMPIPPAHVTVEFATADARRRVTRVFVSLPPGIERETAVRFECPYRGEYDIGAEAIEVTDVLGLVRMRVEGEKLRAGKARLAVVPRTYPLGPGLPDLRMNEGAEDGSRSRTGEVSSISDLRDWREGDPLVRVHWKVSARLGHPIVKEFDGSLDARNLVFADCTGAGFAPDDPEKSEYENRIARLDAAETVVSAAASFCGFFCGEGRSVRLVTCSDERLESESRGQGGGFDALRLHLAGVRFGGSAGAAKMLSVECERYGVPDSLVYITADLSGEVGEALAALADSGSRITVVSCGRLDGREEERLRSKDVAVMYAPRICGGVPAPRTEEPSHADAEEQEEADGYGA